MKKFDKFAFDVARRRRRQIWLRSVCESSWAHPRVNICSFCHGGFSLRHGPDSLYKDDSVIGRQHSECIVGKIRLKNSPHWIAAGEQRRGCGQLLHVIVGCLEGELMFNCEKASPHSAWHRIGECTTFTVAIVVVKETFI